MTPPKVAEDVIPDLAKRRGHLKPFSGRVALGYAAFAFAPEPSAKLLNVVRQPVVESAKLIVIPRRAHAYLRAESSVSRVRMRIACEMSLTKILPSPT